MKAPNLTIPLASSYNGRGDKGYTNTITSSYDQRKINCCYELVKNSITGKATLYLAKRPGVTGSVILNDTTHQLYRLQQAPGSSVRDAPWGFLASSSANYAASTATTTTILTANDYWPAFSDRTLISGVDTVYVQLLKNDVSLAQRVFYSTAIGTWTEISDGDFTGLFHRGKMEAMDGFHFILTSANNVVNSDLNSIANWTATGSIAKQIKQDFPRGLMRLGNQLLACGDETMEPFYNAGNPSGSPLSGIKQLHQRIGIYANGSAISTGTGSLLSGSTDYYATVENKIYFVGRSGSAYSSISVYSYDGSRCEKIGTPGVDKILSEMVGGVGGALFGPYAVTTVRFHGQTAIAIVLTSPVVTIHRALMFFPQWNDWAEWTSGIFLISGNSGSHYIITSIGSNQSQTLTFSDASEFFDDAGTNYLFSTQFKLPPNGGQRKRMLEYGVIGDTARSANTLTVEVSDDDWQTFTTKTTLDLTKVRKIAVQGGTYIERGIRLSNTNALETRLQSFIARVK